MAAASARPVDQHSKNLYYIVGTRNIFKYMLIMLEYWKRKSWTGEIILCMGGYIMREIINVPFPYFLILQVPRTYAFPTIYWNFRTLFISQLVCHYQSKGLIRISPNYNMLVCHHFKYFFCLVTLHACSHMVGGIIYG